MDKYDLSAQKFGAVGMDAPDPYDLAAAKFGGREVVPPAKQTSLAQDIGQHAGNLLAGAVRGAGSIGATLMRPFDTASENKDRRQAMDDALQSMGAEPDSWMYGGGKLAGEIAGTAGAGGVVVGGLKAIPAIASRAAPLIEAIGSSGMNAGGLSGARAVAVRAGGGAVAGGLQSGMVNPGDMTTGAAIGAFTPGALQIAGKFGGPVYDAVKGNKPGAGKLLAQALGVTETDLPNIINALKASPDSIVDGSKLTLSQALQHQGANTPGAKLLERIVSGGPGGDALLNRYAEQSAARKSALEAYGAQTYQGAAREEATMTGDKIGAMLRTQAGDDQAAARAAWESTYGRAAQDGVMLNLPLDAMDNAMTTLGRGTVGAGAKARALVNEANNIGTMEIPAITPLASETPRNSQTLEQAVRAAGGIRGFSGELRDLGIRQSGTTGLINNRSGQQSDILAQSMYDRGFIPDASPDTLIEALRNGGGRRLYANDQVESSAMQRLSEAGMGDFPEASRVPIPVPFDEFQRLRRSAGALGADVGNRPGGETEAGVLNRLSALMTQRADDAANGITMTGDNITPEFLAQYNTARGLTRSNVERYKGGNNIASILRKPSGQNYTLTGDEITNKLWHGGAGLLGDVQNLKGVLSGENFNPAMDQLRKYIMTDAASKTTAAGDMGAALPRYVETRMPGLLEALDSDQLNAITGVASDIRNQDAANSIKGLLGSDTHAKISRALDGGLLDTPIAKAIGGIKGLDIARSKAADMVVQYKGKTLASLLANPKDAAKALADQSFVNSAPNHVLSALENAVSRVAPVVGQKLLTETQ